MTSLLGADNMHSCRIAETLSQRVTNVFGFVSKNLLTIGVPVDRALPENCEFVGDRLTHTAHVNAIAKAVSQMFILAADNISGATEFIFCDNPRP